MKFNIIHAHNIILRTCIYKIVDTQIYMYCTCTCTCTSMYMYMCTVLDSEYTVPSLCLIYLLMN